jgi:hypothetical protein
MAKEIDYDFEATKSNEKLQEDVRPNLRIVRCCMNCKFFRPRRQYSHRGYCMYPDPKSKQPKKRKGESFDFDDMINNWTRTYSTCLCDLFQLKSKKMNIDVVSDWMDKIFLNDGTVKNE